MDVVNLFLLSLSHLVGSWHAATCVPCHSISTMPKALVSVKGNIYTEMSWRLQLEHQLQGLLIPSPTQEQPHRLLQPSLSIHSSSAWKPPPRA